MKPLLAKFVRATEIICLFVQCWCIYLRRDSLSQLGVACNKSEAYSIMILA